VVRKSPAARRAGSIPAPGTTTGPSSDGRAFFCPPHSRRPDCHGFEAFEEVLAATLVGEIWGVGRKIPAQLNEGGITNALELARMDPSTARGGWSVVLERTVRELQGVSCIPLDD
jgi:hypothetical protein